MDVVYLCGLLMELEDGDNVSMRPRARRARVAARRAHTEKNAVMRFFFFSSPGEPILKDGSGEGRVRG